jgi:hypothetical protein
MNMRYIFLAAIFILASIVVHAQPSVNEIVFFGGPGIANTGTQVYLQRKTARNTEKCLAGRQGFEPR